jgi:dihydroneopterin aldolase
MDKIIIENLHIFAYHGVNEEEKINGQNFYLDIKCSLDLSDACLTDNLDDTVSYAKIIKTVKRVFPAQKDDLIERAARRTADAILDEFDKIKKVKIKLKKPEAPINADFDYVAVQITVERD